MKVEDQDINKYEQVDFEKVSESVFQTFGRDDVLNRAKEMQEVKESLAKAPVEGDKVLMVIMSVEMVYGIGGIRKSLTTFFVDGSTFYVVMKSWAEQHSLYGENIVVTLQTVNRVSRMETKLYAIELLDREGNRNIIKAFGIESITGSPATVEFGDIKQEFSPEVQKHWDVLTSRPTDEVVLLVGSEVASLHPKFVEASGDLVVKRSVFGGGWVFNGTHSKLNVGKQEFSSEANAIRLGHFNIDQSINKMEIRYSQTREVIDTEYVEVGLSKIKHEEKIHMQDHGDFFSGEDLGVEAPRRCKDCKNCKHCSFRGQQMSQREAWEYSKYEDGIVYDPNSGRFNVKYVFIDDPRKLRNNRNQALKIGEVTEKRLIKEGLVEKANEVFDKMLEAGAIVELSNEEMGLWDGPVRYQPIQHVVNLDSVTTPVRLVTNTSIADKDSGLSLNSILAKGPMVLGDTWEILIRFRGYVNGLISDITKAYYQLRTGKLEMHLRRIVWRYSDVNSRWRTFAFIVVGMGDRPAATLLEICIRLTVKMFGYIDLVAAARIMSDHFVDDITTGGDDEEVDRFKGNENEDLTCNGTFSQIMAKASLKLKAIAVSGESDSTALKKLGGTVLGMRWSAEKDMLAVRFRANVTKRKRGKPTGPDLTKQDIESLVSMELTKRICLGVTAMQYDPIGLAVPVTIQLKI